MARYFIGDIHGCNRTLQTLLEHLQPSASDLVVFLGDFIDRGPDSKGAVDTARALATTGARVVCLRGNHEQMLLEVFKNPELGALWYRNGGKATLSSFGAASACDIPADYLDFFQSMPLWFETAGYLCVHGGLNFHLPDPLSDATSLMTIRHWYDDINYAWLGNRIVVHGHTPMPLRDIKKQVQYLTQQQCLNLDGGCVYALQHSNTGLGHLVAFEADSRTLYAQPFVG